MAALRGQGQILGASSPPSHALTLSAFHIPRVVLNSLLTGYSELLHVALPASHPLCLVARALAGMHFGGSFSGRHTEPQNCEEKGEEGCSLTGTLDQPWFPVALPVR